MASDKTAGTGPGDTPLRYLASFDGELAVLHVGFRVNRFRSLRKWMRVAREFRSLIRDSERAPGCLGSTLTWSGRTVIAIQYWSGVAELEGYAKDAGGDHHSAWRRFNRSIRGSGAVGIFHETLVVTPDRVESVYVDMPPVLLAAATEVVPVTSPRRRLLPKRKVWDLPLPGVDPEAED